jgi:hypothetical protein
VRINGKLFLILLGLVTLALAVLTLWLWPRLAARGARPVIGRVALLLGTQLSLAASFLFTVNAFGGFYTSWGQLFGTASAQYRLSDAGAAADAAVAGGRLSGLEHGPGRLVGPRSGLSVQLAVFTPPGYAAEARGGGAAGGAGKSHRSSPAPSTTDFPVEVVNLTDGADGQSLPDFQHLADVYRLIVAVVTDPPPSSTSAGSNAASAIPGVNVPAGPQGELFWGQDLRTALAAHYRVDTAPADWGIAGVGASGGAAINLAVQDSTCYGLAAAVGDWTSAPAQDSWPGIDKYLAGVPAPAVRLLYNAAAPGIPGKIQTSDGPLLVAGQSGLDLSSALDWLGASIDADHGVSA